MFSVHISLLVVTFLSLISHVFTLMQTTKEIKPHSRIAPCLHFSNWINVLRKDDVMLEYAGDLSSLDGTFYSISRKWTRNSRSPRAQFHFASSTRWRASQFCRGEVSRGEAKWENLWLYKLGKHGGLVGRILWLRKMLQLATVPTSCSTAKQASSLWRLPKDSAKFSLRTLWAPP